MKVSLDDLEKSIKWIKANTNVSEIRVEEEMHRLYIKTTDKYDKQVTITIYEASADSSVLMPTITSTDRL